MCLSFRRVVYKSRQPAKFASFSARFGRLLSLLLHESKYVVEMDPQPSTSHKKLKLKENAGSIWCYAKPRCYYSCFELC